MEPSLEVYLAAVQAGGADASLISLVFGADWISLFILFILLCMSMVCWAIILLKMLKLTAARWQSSRFMELFWQAKRLDAVYEKAGSYGRSPVAEVFKAGYQELQRLTAAGTKREDATENLERTLRRASTVEGTSLERYVAFLGTTGSTAPFIGLLGTVWGILQAFNKLGAPGAAQTIDVVGPDIAHALVATAAGLAAAIPAVIAFNYFNASIRVLNADMDNFSADFLNIVKRHVK